MPPRSGECRARAGGPIAPLAPTTKTLIAVSFRHVRVSSRPERLRLLDLTISRRLRNPTLLGSTAAFSSSQLEPRRGSQAEAHTLYEAVGQLPLFLGVRR